MADAAAQFTVLLQCDEGPGAAGQCRVTRLVVGDFLALQVSGNGRAGQRQQFLSPGLRKVGRLVAPEHHCPVAHHLPLVAVGRVAGVGVAQHSHRVGPQPLRDLHCHQDGRLTAGTGDQVGEARNHQPVYRLLHPHRIAGLNGGQGGSVRDERVVVGGVVGEVRTGDDDRPPAEEHCQQCVGQCPYGLLVVSAHQHRHDGTSGAHPLEEGQFDLNGVLALVGGGVIGDARVGGDERLGQFHVHRHDPQRRLEAPLGPDGDGIGEGRLVVGGDDNGDVVLPIFQLLEAVGSHRAGVDIACVGHDEAGGFPIYRLDRCQHLVHHPRQFVGLTGVPGASDDGGADAAGGHGERRGHGGKRKRCRRGLRRWRGRRHGASGEQQGGQC